MSPVDKAHMGVVKIVPDTNGTDLSIMDVHEAEVFRARDPCVRSKVGRVWAFA
jgi:hypothetical protein